MLNAARPFFSQAKAALGEVDKLRDALRRLEGIARSGEQLIVLLGPDDRVIEASPAGGALLRWLGSSTRHLLPEPLYSWVQQDRAQPFAGRSLVVKGPHGLLLARLLRGQGGGPAAIVLEPSRDGTDLSSPLALGLGAREMQVLQAVGGGRSNAQVALELRISRHTVAKHLQSIYAKLGVTNRTAAVRAARMSASGRRGDDRS